MPKSAATLVEDWLLHSVREGGYPKILDVVDEEPELAWEAILQILIRELTEDQTALLAAGALEDLLAAHGARFIERVEREARSNPRFKHLLGGVWRHGMPDDLWQRVRSARSEVW